MLPLRATRSVVAAGWSALVVAVGVIGCGDLPDRHEPSETVVRDSAGLQFVEIAGSAAGLSLGWRVSEFPDMEIGVRDGDPAEIFHRIRGVFLFPDGRLLVVDGGSRELRFFSGDGRFERAAGGAGDGPGRFRGVPQLVPASGADSVFVFDPALQRFAVFSAEGAHLRTYGSLNLGESYFDAPFGRVSTTRISGAVGQLAEGVVTYHSVGISGASGVQEEPWAFRWVTPDGEVDREIVAGRMRIWFTTPPGELGQTGMFRVPFSVPPAAAVGPAGFHLLVDGAPEIQVFDLSGELVQVVRAPIPSQEIDETVRDGYIASQVATAPSPAVVELYEREYRRIRLPETIPTFDSLILDPVGCLWARMYSVNQPTAQDWLVFDPDGHARGTVSLPQGLEVKQVGLDFVLGVWVDDAGVERVRRHQLTRAGATSDGACRGAGAG